MGLRILYTIILYTIIGQGGGRCKSRSAGTHL